MMSCGTGITPFYSILTSLHPNSKYTFKLFASFRNKEDTYLVDDIKEYSQVYLSCDGNKITTAIVKEIITEYEEPVVLVCGTHGYATMIQQVCEDNRKPDFVF